jgi:hypothetical protein
LSTPAIVLPGVLPRQPDGERGVSRGGAHHGARSPSGRRVRVWPTVPRGTRAGGAARPRTSHREDPGERPGTPGGRRPEPRLEGPCARTPPLTDRECAELDAHWRALNYLAAGQLYLRDNPLLREELRPEHVKPRLLGHWGTCPGLGLVHTHLNRVISERDLDVLCVWGPGHGAPAVLAGSWLEGTFGERRPGMGRDEAGMARLFGQFSFPGGLPSHTSPVVPGSIQEGGELGHSLSHAYGAAFDNPDLLTVCVVGDGEAETGPLAAS